MSRFVESPELSSALPAGSNYFAFALVGFAFFDYLSVSFTAFDSSIEEARQNRTLEALLVTQTPLPVILAGSAVYPFTALALRTCVYLAWGALLFGFTPRAANWLGAVAILLASILAFAGLGIISAGYSILFKRGNPAKWLVLGISGLVGGMMYPISVLPGPLRFLARLIPVTYSLEGMRAALLGRRGMARAMAFDCRPASFRRDPDPVVVRGFCLGAAPHKSYRHTDAYLNLPMPRPLLWTGAGCSTVFRWVNRPAL